MVTRPNVQAKRGAIYRLLLNGRTTKSQVAKRLKIQPSLVQYHARQLEKEGVLARATKGKRGEAVYYKPGPAAPLFEAGLKGDAKADRLVRSAQLPAAHIHRGHRSLRVLRAPAVPEDAPGHYKMRDPSGVVNHYYRWSNDDGEWVVRFVQGKKKQSVVIYPPTVVTTDPERVENVGQWWDGYVARGGHAWAEAAGFVLERAHAKGAGPVEMAVPIGIPNFGDPARDEVWGDDTPKGALETVTPPVAAAVMRLQHTEGLVRAHDGELGELRRDASETADQVRSVEDVLRSAALLHEHVAAQSERSGAEVSQLRELMGLIGEQLRSVVGLQESSVLQSAALWSESQRDLVKHYRDRYGSVVGPGDHI